MNHLSRRSAIKSMLAAGAAPFVWRAHAHAAPSETVLHASFGAGGMAGADIGSLTAQQAPQARRRRRRRLESRTRRRSRSCSPTCKVYQDWRELLDKEKNLNSVNVSTPDHMHAPITMRAMQRGLHVYTQKPLTQTIYEARRLTEVAAREEARHPDGHPDPLAPQCTSSVVQLIQDGRDRQGEGSP